MINKIILKIILKIIFFFMIVFVTSGSAKNYYVSPVGNDNNNASLEDNSLWNLAAARRHQAKQSTFGHMYDERPGDSKASLRHYDDEGFRQLIAEKNINNVSLVETGVDFTGAVAVLNIGSWLTWAQYVNRHRAGENSIFGYY